MQTKHLHITSILVLLCFLHTFVQCDGSGRNVCDESLLSRYISIRTFESFDSKPILASNQIKELCPTIRYTCCSFDELANMSNIFSEKIKKVKAIIFLFEKFIQRLTFLKISDVEVLYKTTVNNSCSNYSKVEYQAALEYMNKFKSEILENFKNLLNIDLNYNKGFPCELCKEEVSYHFVQGLDGSHMINVNVDSCLKYIPSVAEFLPYVIYSFHKVEILVKTIGCEVGLPFSLDLSINHTSQRIIFEEEMKKCDNAEYIMESSKCLEFCRLGILNNFWGSFIVDVIQVGNVILYEWEKVQKVSHFDDGISKLDYSYDDLKFEYFIDPERSIKGKNIEDYPINIVNSTGWNLFENSLQILSGDAISKINGLLLLGILIFFDS